MIFVVRLWAAVALLVTAAPLLAHGDQKHGEEPRAVSAEVEHAETGRDAATTGDDVPSAVTPSGNESEQVGRQGVVATLKSLHPATVHFPIALFLMAALTELFVLSRRTPERESAVGIMLYGAAAGGIIAVLFGWVHTGIWLGGDTVMQLHRWIGMLIAFLGLAAASIAHRKSESRLTLRLLLFPIAALLLVQGFLGGELAHGINHLKF